MTWNDWRTWRHAGRVVGGLVAGQGVEVVALAR